MLPRLISKNPPKIPQDLCEIPTMVDRKLRVTFGLTNASQPDTRPKIEIEAATASSKMMTLNAAMQSL